VWLSWLSLPVPVLLLSGVLMAQDADLGSRSVEGNLEQEEERIAEAAAWFATGMALQAEGKVAEAMDAFANSASLDPSNLPVVEQVIPFLLSARKNDKAIEILQKAIRIFPDRDSLRSLLGMTYIASNRLEEALELNLETLESNPDSITALRSVLMVYFQEGQGDKIEELVRKAMDVETRSPSGWVQIAGILAQFVKSGQGESEKLGPWIDESLDRAIKGAGDDTEVVAQAGTIYEELGRRDKAINCYEQVLERPKVPGSVRTRLAFLYLQQGMNDKAGDLAEVIRREEPLNPFGYRISGYLAQDADEWEKAASFFSDAVKYAPDFEPGYFDLFTALLNGDRVDKARETLAKIGQRFEPGFQFHYYTGILDAREEQFEDAVSAYEKALAAASESEPQRLTHFFYFQLGVACERARKLEESEKYFTKCLELNPEFSEAMNYLGYTFADNDMKLDRALELIEKAVSMEPENPAYLDSLAWVHYKLGNYTKALRYQLKAVEFSTTDDPIMFDHLGDIYMKLDRPARAREAWEKSIAVDEENEVSEGVRKKLSDMPAAD
jgi:tetratricopeptide (TPR) repeat protein